MMFARLSGSHLFVKADIGKDGRLYSADLCISLIKAWPQGESATEDPQFPSAMPPILTAN